jgi:hypothetical protein
MNALASKIQGHQVWSVLETSISTIQEFIQATPEISPEALEYVERARQVLAFSRKRLLSTDSNLISNSTLDAVSSNIVNLKSHFDAFSQSRDISQLSAVNQYIDQLLLNVGPIFVPASDGDIDFLFGAISEYRIALNRRVKTAVSAQSQILARQAAFDEKALSLESAISHEQKRIVEILLEMQSSFSASQDRRASEYAEWHADSVARRTELAAEQQSSFSLEQDNRRTMFSESQGAFDDKIKKQIGNFETDYRIAADRYSEKAAELATKHREVVEQLNNSFKIDAAVILEKMHLNKKEVEELVGVIGNLGVTSGYKGVADHARISLYLWQSLTVLALGAVVFVAALIAFPGWLSEVPVLSVSATQELRQASDATSTVQLAANIASQEFYQKIFSRVILSIALGIFATYSSRQAAKFLLIEQKNRKMALELEALGPFIAPLEKVERDKFRVQIGDRSFAVNETAGKPVDDDVTLISILKSKDIREKLVEFFRSDKDGK